MRRLILTSASVLALSVGGTSVGLAADMSHSTAPNSGANMPATSGTSQYGTNAGATAPAPYGVATDQQGGVNLPSSEIKQAQEQLRDQGLYHDTIDGILGPATKQALRQFQQKNGLAVTATLDQQTMDKLFGAGQGSSMPPSSQQGIGSNQRMAPPAGSSLGDHTPPTR